MHDSVGLQKGTSLQSAKLQIANLLQNCYFCLIQKTISNSVLWPLVIKYFWPGCFAPPYLLRPGATAPLCPPLLRHWIIVQQNRVKEVAYSVTIPWSNEHSFAHCWALAARFSSQLYTLYAADRHNTVCVTDPPLNNLKIINCKLIVITNWQGCGLTSHSAQNMPLRRRSSWPSVLLC